MSGAGGAASAAAAAAQRKRLIDQEEEEMTKYSPEDLDEWEFKILRANTLAFKNHDSLKKAIEEESQAGWVFLEKFDDARLRFKRKIKNRDNDSNRTIDPYRTVYGVSQWWIFLALMAGIFGFVLIILLIGIALEGL